MNVRTFGAAALTIAGLAGVAFAAPQDPPPTQTQQVEKVRHEETTVVNKNGDTTSTAKTTSTTTVSQTAPAPQTTAGSDLKATDIIPWSYANHGPTLPGGQQPALYIWHDKNTVYVATVGDDSGAHRWEGSIDIMDGRFDTLKNVSTDAEDHFNQDGLNKITFQLNTARKQDMFKFNLRSGTRIRFHITMDGQKTDRIYFGGPMAQAHGDPVVFDLNR